MKTPPILPTAPLFSNFVLPPPSTPAPARTLFVALFLWLNGWLRHICCVNFYLVTLWIQFAHNHVKPLISTYHTKTMRCVLCKGVCSQRHKAHTEANRLTRLYKCILTPPFMCSQQLSGITLNELFADIKNLLYFIEFHNVFLCFKDDLHICWLDSIRSNSFHETPGIPREMV